jgi:cytochrome c oxidase cbb3-type subunit 3
MESDKLLHEKHSYDGIQEFDNPLPRWWVYMFYITIVVTPWHLAYYGAKGHVLKSLKPQETAIAWSAGMLAYNVEMNKPKEKEMSSEEMTAIIKSPEAITKGKEDYLKNCLACHGADGQGIVGPNLTDAYWIHGSDQQSIVKVIAEGVPQKGMVAWKPILGNQKVLELTAFILSLEGTNPPNPKNPEGKKKS